MLMLPRLILTAALERSVNHLIAMDPDAYLFLEPLAGKTIAINLPPLGLELYCCPTLHGVQFIEHLQGEPDTRLTGSPIALALIGMSNSPQGALFAGEVTIEGDVHVARRFQDLFEKLDIDWEEQLSRYTGDVIAHRVGTLIRASRDWCEESLETLKLNTAEYLQEETRELPTEVEADIFFDRVDALRSDCDRLQARVERLQAVLNDDGPG